MKRVLGFLAITVLSLAMIPSTAHAAKPINSGGGPKPSPTTELVGYDVSYPQCGRALPTDHYFAIVGVNDGLANGANPCLADQLNWAYTSKDGSKQAKVQLYVNTANPGEVISQISTWPTSPYDLSGNLPPNPYGNACAGQNNEACSWLYGWNRSIYTESVFKNAANSRNLNNETKDYVWWLDVETINTWQSGSNQALMRNTAAIEGFGAYYQSKGASIGLYSTAVQWKEITGNNIKTASNLIGLPNWRPSGSRLANAIKNCNVAPLTSGGYISLTQYVLNNLDHNHSCI